MKKEKLTNAEIFRNNLIKAMERKQVSRADIARETSINAGSMSSYLAGEAEPKVSTLLELADYLDTSTDALCGKTDFEIINLDKKETAYIVDTFKNLNIKGKIFFMDFVKMIKHTDDFQKTEEDFNFN